MQTQAETTLPGTIEERSALPPLRVFSVMAIVAFCLSILWLGGLGSLLGIVLGTMAMKRAWRLGQGGTGLAVAAIIIGVVGVASTVAAGTVAIVGATVNNSNVQAQLTQLPEQVVVTPANALDVITVGGTDAAPTVTFKTKPLSVKVTTTKVITAGKGAKLSKDNSILFNYVLFNGKDGKQIESSFGKATAGLDLSSTTLLPGLAKSLIGQQIGSRLLVAIPPGDAFGAQGNAQAGFGPTDTVVFFIDLVSTSTPLKTATGTVVPPKAGLPTATVDGAKAANITVPKTAAPTTLIVQPLIKGSGAIVKAGQTIKVNYTGVLWKDGKKFDASGDHGASFDTAIGKGQVIAGWDKGLVGQTVGSRILLVVPPAEGYGAKGSPPLIGAEDTLVFVIDILAAS